MEATLHFAAIASDDQMTAVAQQFIHQRMMSRVNDRQHIAELTALVEAYRTSYAESEKQALEMDQSLLAASEGLKHLYRRYVRDAHLSMWITLVMTACGVWAGWILKG